MEKKIICSRFVDSEFVKNEPRSEFVQVFVITDSWSATRSGGKQCKGKNAWYTPFAQLEPTSARRGAVGSGGTIELNVLTYVGGVVSALCSSLYGAVPTSFTQVL